MSNRMQRWIAGEAALNQDGHAPYPVRLTPGQYAELAAELGAEPETVRTKLGLHPVERISCNVAATGENVILCPRPDLFVSSEADVGLQLFNENSLTSIPDNVGCCEVLSVGDMVDSVKPGDIAFIDFFDVKQGYVIASGECYVAPGDCFKALWRAATHELVPLANYVVTRRASARMRTAITGSDLVHLPEYRLTGGQVSGRTSSGTEVTHALYEEVVAVGPITHRPKPGLMTRIERELLASLEGDSCGLNQDLWDAFRAERKRGREPDIRKGDLVAFAVELATPLRVKGEFWHLVKYDDVLAAIDDATILTEAIARGAARMLVSA